MAQYGFFFDQSRCIGCHTCAVACKNWNDLPPGPVKWLKVFEYEKGSFPNVEIHIQLVHCFHCENPICVDNCPYKAMYKEEKYGVILIDEEKCTGCRICYTVCPYGAPAFESDELGAKPRMCTMCIDRLEQGKKPICVMSCPMRALDFGPLEKLANKYGRNRDLEDMPSSSATYPAVIFKPRVRKKKIVRYDVDRALELLMRREPLPEVFSNKNDVTEVTKGLVGRNKLMIKPKSSEELMRQTRNSS